MGKSFFLLTLLSLTLPLSLLSAQSSPQTTSQLQAALEKGELDSRRAAAIATRTCDPATQQQLLPTLIAQLQTERDGQIRLAILDTLHDMGPAAADAIPALVQAMRENFGGRGEEERHQDFRAALALSRIGKPAVTELRKLLSDDTANLRAEAAMALGRIGPPASEAMPELIDVLDDESQQVQRDAIIALGKLGDAAKPAILEAVRSESTNRRVYALQALGNLATATKSAAGDSQIIAAAQAATRDSDPSVRAAAVPVLNVVSDKDGQLQESLIELLTDRDEGVRTEVVNALAQRPQMLEQAESDLAQLLINEDRGVAWHAAFLLHLRGAAAAPVMLRMAADERSHIEEISKALARIGQPLTPMLESRLQDPNPRVRQAAALALGEIRPISAETIAKLAQGLQDEHPEVRTAFLRSLRSMGARAQPAVPAVRQLRSTAAVASRLAALDILLAAAPRDQQLIEDLIAFVDDADPSVQARSIDAIRATGPFGRPAIAAVSQKLASSNNSVRVAAADFLASHGSWSAPAVPQLIAMLGSQSQDIAWRTKLISTLGELGATAQTALPELSACLRAPQPEIRAAAIRAIANLQLEPQQIQSQLVLAFQDSDESVRDQALGSLRQFSRRATLFVPDLISLLAAGQGSESESQSSLERSLERLERYPADPSAVPRLIELLQHDQPRVQLLAIKFTGLAGPAAQSAAGHLETFLQHTDPTLRAAAQQSLEQIK